MLKLIKNTVTCSSVTCITVFNVSVKKTFQKKNPIFEVVKMAGMLVGRRLPRGYIVPLLYL